MAVVGVTTGPHAPGLKTKENMYGDAVVDLADNDDVFHDAKLDLGSSPDAQPAGIRPSDSWLDVTQSAGERRGMHVTFQVQRQRNPLPKRHADALTCTAVRCCDRLTGFACLAHHAICMFGAIRSASIPTVLCTPMQDVYYIVKNQANKREKLSILSGVSGFFNPGEMAAVMGPSGSGAALEGISATNDTCTASRASSALLHSLLA